MSVNTLSAQPKRLIGYSPSWGIHAQNYHVADIPAAQLTHIIYALADVTAAGGCVCMNVQDNPSVPQSGRNKRAAPARQSPPRAC